MADLNYILQDQSENDKLLVKELSTYIKNHRDKEKPINKQFILDIIGIILSNDKDLLLEKVDFIETKDQSFWGQFGDNILHIYINNLNSYFHGYKKKGYSNIADCRLRAYEIILEVILHEFTHAKQEKLSKEYDYDLYKSSYEFCYQYFYDYTENLSIIPIERFAKIRSMTLTYEVLSYIYEPSKIKVARAYALCSLISGYTYDEENQVISPAEEYKNKMLEFEITHKSPNTENYNSLYERMYLGKEITSQELDSIIDSYYKILSGEEKETDIKKLIRRADKK